MTRRTGKERRYEQEQGTRRWRSNPQPRRRQPPGACRSRQGLPVDAASAGGRAGDEWRGELEQALARLRSERDGDRQLGPRLRERGSGSTGAPETWRSELAVAWIRHAGEARGGGRAASRAPGVGHASHPRRAGTLLGARGERDGGASDPARGGAHRRDSGGVAGARPPAASLRASSTQPDVAVGHLHLPAATPRAPLRGGLHGRPLALPGGLVDGASPEVGSRDGGAATSHRGVGHAARDPDRPGASVHGMARRDGLRAGAATAGDPSRQEPPTASADAGQGGALLEDAVGRVSLTHGLQRLPRLRTAARSVRRCVQLPAPASGHRRSRPRGPILPGGAARARSDREGRDGQLDASVARTGAQAALLHRRPPRRP